jgi:hypothetical protein
MQQVGKFRELKSKNLDDDTSDYEVILEFKWTFGYTQC